jgi:hypothetical protein
MGSLSLAKLVLVPSDRRTCSLHALIRSASPGSISKKKRINFVGCCVENTKNNKTAIDFSDPDWKTKYEEDFEKRFNIPHLTDFFPDSAAYPSTFCLRMRFFLFPFFICSTAALPGLSMYRQIPCWVHKITFALQ